ncbi:hypothetical protein GvMRE_IIg223 [endosymbiont GvMRE of Glomus versiforme]|nr:hypothetical protein GvMRE_IIg223 [endosymbiont GvMRE of Glomus versiforme]
MKAKSPRQYQENKQMMFFFLVFVLFFCVAKWIYRRYIKKQRKIGDEIGLPKILSWILLLVLITFFYFDAFVWDFAKGVK